VEELRRRIAAGALGTLLHAEGNFCVDRYGHFKWDDWKGDRGQVLPGSLADHMLYALIELLGPVAEVDVHGATHTLAVPIADTTAVLLRFKNNASGLLTAIGVTPEYYRLAVFGSKGWIELRGNEEFTFQPKEGAAETIRFPRIDTERAELEAFADVVAGRRPFPYALEDAVHSAAVLEAMGESAASGKPAAVR
jgi:predicted dehydrogenase